MAPDLRLAPFWVSVEFVVNLFRADLWTPFVEAALITVDDIGHDHAGDGENQNTDENFVGLECRAGDRNHEADTGSSRVQLADHDADECAADSQTKAGQNKRHSRRQHN